MRTLKVATLYPGSLYVSDTKLEKKTYDNDNEDDMIVIIFFFMSPRLQ